MIHNCISDVFMVLLLNKDYIEIKFNAQI